MQKGLRQLQQIRLARAQNMAAKLERLGVENVYQRAQTLAAGGQITRTHFARLLIESDHAKSMQQCFKRYLKPGKPGYVSVEWAGLDQAIDWIHHAGGVAVLAHPLAYGMTAAWRTRTLKAFTEAGGDALEVHCGSSNPADVQLSARDAAEFQLMGSVGSDFHGTHQRWLKLGRVLSLPSSIPPVWTHPSLQSCLSQA